METLKYCKHCGTTVVAGLAPGFLIHQPTVLGSYYYGGISAGNGRNEKGTFSLISFRCQVCHEFTVLVEHQPPITESLCDNYFYILPFGKERPVADAVPDGIASDFKEATRIAEISPKGAATLARRALQGTLRNLFPDMPHNTLGPEIDWLKKHKPTIPDPIIKALFNIKDVGNFGAHPEKDGMPVVFDLNAKTLENCFIILEALFEKYYVEPELLKKKMDELNDTVSGKAQDSTTKPVQSGTTYGEGQDDPPLYKVQENIDIEL